MSIGSVAAGAAVTAGFGLAFMGAGALMRERDPAPDHDPARGLRWTIPLAIGGLGLAAGMAAIPRVGDAGLAVFAIGGLAGGLGAMATGAALGQLLLDD